MSGHLHDWARFMYTSDGRWWGDQRLLLAFAPDSEHPDFLAQLQLLTGYEDRMRAQRLVFGQVLERGRSRLGDEPLPPSKGMDLRRRFGVGTGQFVLVLVGLDGQEQARSTEATPVPDVLAKLDEVPLGRRDVEEARARRRRGRT